MAMPNNQTNRSSGFTLVELLLAITISIFLIGGVVLIQSSSRAASIESERLSRLQETVRFTSDFLVREMRNAGFRDQLSLTIAEFDTIGGTDLDDDGNVDDGTGFAVINDGSDPDYPDGSLTLRYSGRGSCAEGFLPGTMLDSTLVENTYFVDAGTGELKCRGISGSGSSDPDPVALAAGIEDIAFEFLCPPTNPDCECRLWVHTDDFDEERDILNETCYGIRIGLLLEPIEPGSAPTPVELSATFRNIVLGELMWNAVSDLP